MQVFRETFPSVRTNLYDPYRVFINFGVDPAAPADDPDKRATGWGGVPPSSPSCAFSLPWLLVNKVPYGHAKGPSVGVGVNPTIFSR